MILREVDVGINCGMLLFEVEKTSPGKPKKRQGLVAIMP
jgi:hypothetical protein